MTAEKGPYIYENWKAYQKDSPIQKIVEYELYTDAHIIGSPKNRFGPYQLYNTVPLPKRTPFQPSIVVGIAFCLTDALTSLDDSDQSRYHAVSPHDEIAALLALILGIRISAGRQLRVFVPEGSAMGEPSFLSYKDIVFPLSSKQVLPYATKKVDITEIAELEKLALLNVDEANILIKSARLYQQGIWIADSDPEL